MLSNEIKEIFSNTSVATICTALFKKGLKNQFIQGVSPLNTKLPNMVSATAATASNICPNLQRSNRFQDFEGKENNHGPMKQEEILKSAPSVHDCINIEL